LWGETSGNVDLEKEERRKKREERRKKREERREKQTGVKFSMSNVKAQSSNSVEPARPSTGFRETSGNVDLEKEERRKKKEAAV
ncbi:MAG: hypothetical protein COY19_09190, partial [Candidatus Marinimicrobia bacterium CG_4_10_14_0_2_um_filter_48_9]